MIFNIKLLRRGTYNVYGEYEKIDFENARAILSDCLLAGNIAHIKVLNNIFLDDRSIKNNNDLRLFIEEFGGIKK